MVFRPLVPSLMPEAILRTFVPGDGSAHALWLKVRWRLTAGEYSASGRIAALDRGRHALRLVAPL